jgi:hypothetical protein
MLFFIENSISLHRVNLFLGQRISGADTANVLHSVAMNKKPGTQKQISNIK